MKVERFIIEYANSKIRGIERNTEMNIGVKNELVRRIDRAVFMRESGIITADEAIKVIGGFVDANEDMSQFMA